MCGIEKGVPNLCEESCGAEADDTQLSEHEFPQLRAKLGGMEVQNGPGRPTCGAQLVEGMGMPCSTSCVFGKPIAKSVGVCCVPARIIAWTLRRLHIEATENSIFLQILRCRNLGVLVGTSLGNFENTPLGTTILG